MIDDSPIVRYIGTEGNEEFWHHIWILRNVTSEQKAVDEIINHYAEAAGSNGPGRMFHHKPHIVSFDPLNSSAIVHQDGGLDI